MELYKIKKYSARQKEKLHVQRRLWWYTTHPINRPPIVTTNSHSYKAPFNNPVKKGQMHKPVTGTKLIYSCVLALTQHSQSDACQHTLTYARFMLWKVWCMPSFVQVRTKYTYSQLYMYMQGSPVEIQIPAQWNLISHSITIRPNCNTQSPTFISQQFPYCMTELGMFKKLYPLTASKIMYTYIWECLCQSSYLKPLSQVRLKQ